MYISLFYFLSRSTDSHVITLFLQEAGRLIAITKCPYRPSSAVCTGLNLFLATNTQYSTTACFTSLSRCQHPEQQSSKAAACLAKCCPERPEGPAKVVFPELAKSKPVHSGSAVWQTIVLIIIYYHYVCPTPRHHRHHHLPPPSYSADTFFPR